MSLRHDGCLSGHVLGALLGCRRLDGMLASRQALVPPVPASTFIPPGPDNLAVLIPPWVLIDVMMLIKQANEIWRSCRSFVIGAVTN